MSQRPDKKTNEHSEITHNSGIKSVSHRSQAKTFFGSIKDNENTIAFSSSGEIWNKQSWLWILKIFARNIPPSPWIVWFQRIKNIVNLCVVYGPIITENNESVCFCWWEVIKVTKRRQNKLNKSVWSIEYVQFPCLFITTSACVDSKYICRH